MRHFDAWLLRDPYSIFHYYSTGRRWQETVRDLIHERKICSPPSPLDSEDISPVDPYARPLHPQSTCDFLQRLPPEIRLLIYQYVFGPDVVVHLVQLKGHIRHVRCHETRSSLARNRRCCPVTPARWRIHDHHFASSSSSSPPSSQENKPSQPGAQRTDAVLYPHSHAQLPHHLSDSSPALLRTCRAIYAEAADLLYRDRVFDVDDLHTFIAFSRAISARSRRAINRLTIHWVPIFPPLTNPDHPSSAASSTSIFTHTHNDHLWSLFWSRVASLPNLKELLLAIDLGRFTAANFIPPLTTTTTTTTTNNNNNTTGSTNHLLTNPRLRLAIDEPWVKPLLAVRGVQHFDLAITARCDPVAKRLLEPDLCREAGTLRDHLRAVLCASSCSPPDDPLLLPPLLPQTVREVLLSAASSCAGETDGRSEGGRIRRRLAITAA